MLVFVWALALSFPVYQLMCVLRLCRSLFELQLRHFRSISWCVYSGFARHCVSFSYAISSLPADVRTQVLLDIGWDSATPFLVYQLMCVLRFCRSLCELQIPHFWTISWCVYSGSAGHCVSFSYAISGLSADLCTQVLPVIVWASATPFPDYQLMCVLRFCWSLCELQLRHFRSISWSSPSPSSSSRRHQGKGFEF